MEIGQARVGPRFWARPYRRNPLDRSRPLSAAGGVKVEWCPRPVGPALQKPNLDSVFGGLSIFLLLQFPFGSGSRFVCTPVWWRSGRRANQSPTVSTADTPWSALPEPMPRSEVPGQPRPLQRHWLPPRRPSRLFVGAVGRADPAQGSRLPVTHHQHPPRTSVQGHIRSVAAGSWLFPPGNSGQE